MPARVVSGLDLDDVVTAMPQTLDGSTALDTAATLRRCALAFTQGDRLRMLAPLRAHVQHTHPVTAEELRPSRDTFLELARSGADVWAADNRAVMTRLTREQLNCRWAVAVALDECDPASVSAALGLGDFIQFSGLGGADLIERARNLARQVHDALSEAKCLQSLGNIALARSDPALARFRLEAALLIYHQIGAGLGEANCLQKIGDVAVVCGEQAEARHRYEAALPMFEKIRDRVVAEADKVAAATQSSAGMRAATDRDGRPVMLFESEWALDYCARNHPGVQLAAVRS